MVKLIDVAKNYEPKKIRNIADLDSVPIDIEVEDDEYEFEDEQGNIKTIKQKVAVIDGERYRVPNSVLRQLKVLLEDNPNLTKFKVKKTGSGLNTEYIVIPILQS